MCARNKLIHPDDDRKLVLYGNQEIEILGNFYGEIKFNLQMEINLVEALTKKNLTRMNPTNFSSSTIK